jgi:hypothetical protein
MRVDMTVKQQQTIEQLCQTYREAAQIGLVVGAGVTFKSGVPLYKDFANQLFDLARQQRKLRKVEPAVVKYVQANYRNLDPEIVLQLVDHHLKKRDDLPWLVRKVLYRQLGPVGKRHRTIAPGKYTENSTLNAVITFCSARPDGPVVQVPERTRWEVNPRIGAILTTNYDNLVEGAFGSKYGIMGMKPVAREESRETRQGKELVIPVYHMHGYVSYVGHVDDDSKVRASDQLVMAEDDYYRTFYNLLGFANVRAMSVLRAFPCVFVGCSLDDTNLRRVLYQLRRERIRATRVMKYFVILPNRPSGQREFEDAVFDTLGVKIIRLESDEENEDMGAEITQILKKVYTSIRGVDDGEWEYALAWRWALRESTKKELKAKYLTAPES